MALNRVEMGLGLALVVLLWNGAAAQSGCTRALMGLSRCLNYVTGNSSTPSSSCCSQLTSVVQSQPQCLCSFLNGGGASMGIAINQTLALALPGACNVQTPPLSQCNAASGPASGPAASAPIPVSAPVGSPAESTPSDSSNGKPETPPTGSESDTPSAGSGSKTFPSTDGASSDGSTIKSPFHMAMLLLFIISCASSATGF